MGIFNELIQDILNNPHNIYRDENGTYSYITKGIKQYHNEPLPISPAEQEAKEFDLILNQIKNDVQNILHNDDNNINKKEKLIKQATTDVNLLFIEMMKFIFSQCDRDNYLNIEYHLEYERVILKGHFSGVFSNFMNSFDINLNNVSSEFYQKNMQTLSLNNNTTQTDFMNTFEKYYQKYNDLPLQTKQSNKKLKK